MQKIYSLLHLFFLFLQSLALPSTLSECNVAVIIDPYFMTINQNISLNHILASMKTVDQIYYNNYRIRLPVTKMVVIDSSFKNNFSASSSDELLKKIQRLYSNNFFANQGVFPGSHCLIQIYTFQNFGKNLGQSYTGESGGICTKFYNIAVINSYANNKAIPFEDFIQTTAHETGHSFGASHDSGSCVDEGAPFIMNAIIKGGKNSKSFSNCSRNQIVQRLKTNSYCLKPTGTFPYLQYK